jgi:hypothetical protein
VGRIKSDGNLAALFGVDKKTLFNSTRRSQGFSLGRVEVGVRGARVHFLAELLPLEAVAAGPGSEVCISEGSWVAGPGSEVYGIVDCVMMRVS